MIIWNTIVNQENAKIASMQNLMDELMVSNHYDRDELARLDTQLNRVSEMKLTQESLKDSTLMKEYSVAFHSLVLDLVSLAESNSSFTGSDNVQKMTDAIKETNQRTITYRNYYDLLVKELNVFIDKNEKDLRETDQQLLVKKMAQFPLVSSE
jgi:hypothetical protein